MAKRGKIVYDEDYIRDCFNFWYLNSRPQIARLVEMVPAHSSGRKPSVPEMTRWMTQGFWHLRADELDARAIEVADDELVTQKVQILKRHQQNAQKIATKALESMLAQGFDSSSSAVQAYFRATEEERKTQGFSDLLEKLENMSNNQVRDEILNLISRAVDNDQIVEGSTTEVKQLEENTESDD